MNLNVDRCEVIDFDDPSTYSAYITYLEENTACLKSKDATVGRSERGAEEGAEKGTATRSDKKSGDTQDERYGDRVAAKGCLFKDGRMLVLHKPEDARRRSAVPNREEDLPGGCVEKGESLRMALEREVMEETGLKVEVGAPFNAWTVTTPVRRILEVDFVCRWVSGEVVLSWEHESFEWLTLDEIRQRHWEMEDVYAEAFRIYEEMSSDRNSLAVSL